MSKRNQRKIIEDVRQHGVPEFDVSELIDVFAYAVNSIAPTLARRAWFELGDFKSSSKSSVKRYSLDLSRKLLVDREIWIGHFEHNEKWLEVMGSLEDEN